MENNQVQPAQYSYNPLPSSGEEEKNPVMIRRKVKSSYSWASSAMIIQLVIILIVSVVCSTVLSSISLSEYMVQNPNITQEQIMEKSMEISQNVLSDGSTMLIVNTICYLIANIGTFILCTAILKTFKAKDIIGKNKLGAKNTVLALLTILGMQGFSSYFQMLITAITGATGITDSTAEMLSFDGNIQKGILLFVYMVIIAPITEELLCRGFVLNALAPVNRTFAVFASAILFGLMHGNFNQMFNGFLLGLLLGYVAIKSGSVIPAILAHMAANFNGIFCMFVYEYKVLNAVGEDAAMTAEMIHMAVMLVIGIAAFICLFKNCGKIKDTDKVASNTYELAPEEASKLTWKAFLTRPSFWIVAAVYIVMAISSVTAVTA